VGACGGGEVFSHALGSFSSDYEYDYVIRHFRAKLCVVCLRHLAKVVVGELLHDGVSKQHARMTISYL
jgi:hypothetical protein